MVSSKEPTAAPHRFRPTGYVVQSTVCLDFINSFFSCSKHTNMMTFQDASLRKEGTNLGEHRARPVSHSKATSLGANLGKHAP